MAGGDGSQAAVAAIAAEHALPYACVPAGTRNHFALDLGVDRDDVVGALDALVDGGERVVDLAEVNGRVFVNNVSLGVYGEAVQLPGYREAKLRTLLDTIPDVVGPDAQRQPLCWTDLDGRQREGRATVLVSNNRYRLGRPLGSGTRPAWTRVCSASSWPMPQPTLVPTGLALASVAPVDGGVVHGAGPERVAAGSTARPRSCRLRCASASGRAR